MRCFVSLLLPDGASTGPDCACRMAKYPLVKYTDMTAEMKEEAMDVCITAVEKYHADMEKCTQVGSPGGGGGGGGVSQKESVCRQAAWGHSKIAAWAHTA